MPWPPKSWSSPTTRCSVSRSPTYRTRSSVTSSKFATASMDIEEFYDQDPRRRASDETEFGREWSEDDRRFEVSWIADTGEVYIMAEPYSRREISTESVTVEVLGVIKGRDAINSALAGWREAMAKPNSLTWMRARVAGRSDS